MPQCFAKSVIHAMLGKRNLTFSRTLCGVGPHCHLSKVPAAAEGIVEMEIFKVLFRCRPKENFFLVEDLDFPLDKNSLCQ